MLYEPPPSQLALRPLEYPALAVPDVHERLPWPLHCLLSRWEEHLGKRPSDDAAAEAGRKSGALIPGPPHGLLPVDLATYFAGFFTSESWRWCTTVSTIAERRPSDRTRLPMLPVVHRRWLLMQTRCSNDSCGLTMAAQANTLAANMEQLNVAEALWVTLIGRITFGDCWFEDAATRTCTPTTRNRTLCVGWWHGKVRVFDCDRSATSPTLGMAAKFLF